MKKYAKQIVVRGLKFGGGTGGLGGLATILTLIYFIFDGFHNEAFKVCFCFFRHSKTPRNTLSQPEYLTMALSPHWEKYSIPNCSCLSFHEDNYRGIGPQTNTSQDDHLTGWKTTSHDDNLKKMTSNIDDIKGRQPLRSMTSEED